MDVFHRDDQSAALSAAQAWQADNDSQIQTYGFNNRRIMWATYEKSSSEFDMSQVWPLYYTADSYARNLAVKSALDPNNIFSANSFAIRAVATPAQQQ